MEENSRPFAAVQQLSGPCPESSTRRTPRYQHVIRSTVRSKRRGRGPSRPARSIRRTGRRHSAVATSVFLFILARRYVVPRVVFLLRTVTNRTPGSRTKEQRKGGPTIRTQQRTYTDRPTRHRDAMQQLRELSAYEDTILRAAATLHRKHRRGFLSGLDPVLMVSSPFFIPYE